MAKQSSAQTEEHKHWWVPGNDYSSEKCNCGSLKVSPMEYKMRVKAWESYFELVRTTESYKDWMEFKGTNKEAMVRAKKRLEKDEYLDKPSFPDPATWNKYIVGGVV